MIVVGVGGRARAEPAALLELVAKALADHGRTFADITEVATIDRRVTSDGVRTLVEATGSRLRAWPSATLAEQRVEAGSGTVALHVGTPSVAEAAVRASGAVPLAGRHTADGWVVVIGEAAEVAGTGPDLLHHGDAEVAPRMLDFAVNVHDSRPPEFLRRALREAVDDLARYPDPTAATQAVAAAHGVPAESVLLTAGAAEAFTLVAQQPWQSPAVVHPQFTEPEAALLAAGHRVHRILLEERNGFGLDGAAAHGGIAHGADLVIVGNPTNPTSQLHDPERIAGLGGFVVIDEAFMDAVEDLGNPRHSLARAAANDQSLLVIRSLTKTYSIAGLRVGYVIGHPDVLARLAARRPPWPVSSLAAAAAVACLSDEGRAYAAEVRRGLNEQLIHLAGGLRAAGFVVPPGARAPFLIARHEQAQEIRESLRAQGIAVRRGDTFPGLGAEWLRFAARDRAATDRLLAGLAAIRQST